MTATTTETGDSTFGFVRERDIDFMLVEELTCSHAFQTWFLQSVLTADQPVPQVTTVAVRQGVNESGDGSGESDVIVDFKIDSGVIRIRVENKIDAVFQPNQIQRYLARAEDDRTSGSFHLSLCLLLAPNDYIESASDKAEKFDATLAYEEIIEFLEQRTEQADDELGLRCKHKIDILEHAIDKRRRGYAPDVCVEVTDFWLGYWEHANQSAGELRLDRPGPKPRTSSFVHFNRAIKSKRPLPECKIKHKLAHGLVDLEIAGWADRLEKLSPAITPLLGPGMRLRQAGKSLAISIEVPMLDIVGTFDEQRESAQTGLEAALRLKAWFALNHDNLCVYTQAVTS